MTQFFQFEADFVDSLRCIPMQVRYKLDTCGVKLKLSHWHQLTPAERQTLVSMPCTTETETQAYRSYLRDLVHLHTGEFPSDLPVEAEPDWTQTATIPASVQEKGTAIGTPITLEQWASLSSVQRFALIKLSRSQHENKNFLPALKEFRLV
jgi:hypothetical protein